MSKFPTLYTEHKTISVNPGKRMKDEKQLRIVDGKEELVKIGETDFYDYIQSHADSVDINKIIARCVNTGDFSELNVMPSRFMDTVGMPKTLAEAHVMIKDAENYFNHLPTDIKKQYNNNFTEFIQDIGTSHFENVVKSFVDSVKSAEVPESEVKPDA